MFHFVFRSAFKTNGYFVKGDSSIFLLRSICSSYSNNSIVDHDPFTVSYLVNHCGLSQEKATSISRKFKVKDISGPDSVLAAFRKHNFPITLISRFIEIHPQFLLANPNKVIIPKLEFFLSFGFSVPELLKLLWRSPNILSQSIENAIKPSISFLKTFVHTDKNVITVIKRSHWVLQQCSVKTMAHNIAVLQSHGTPDHIISFMLMTHANTLFRSPRFSEIMDELKKMKFDVSKHAFAMALRGMLSMSKSSWEGKLKVYKSLGWTEDEILMAFKRDPSIMSFSEKKIRSSVDFLVNKMAYDPMLIKKHSRILYYSLEKRIIPRLLVFQVLKSNGCVQHDYSLITLLSRSNKHFLETFVMKFVEEVPKLLDIYEGKTNTQ